MNTKHTRRAAAAIAVVLGCLGFLAGPASAATHTGTIVPPSSIILHGNITGDHEFKLGAPPEDPPPSSCGLPDPVDWEPSTIDFDITGTSVTTSFSFEPGHAPVNGSDYRAQISGGGSGTVLSNGDVDVTVTGSVDFSACSPGYPYVCSVGFSANLTGTITPYPVVAGSTATVTGTASLSPSSSCPLPFIFELAGATADVVFVIDF